ncbi:hypothetical protein GGR57DRAFT_182300 [Xylariaceae sp. FL1272]|nr:hypothetical protein GGR57DRAFT_182300 [Xylariaceae sp. FL1272]
MAHTRGTVATISSEADRPLEEFVMESSKPGDFSGTTYDTNSTIWFMDDKNSTNVNTASQNDEQDVRAAGTGSKINFIRSSADVLVHPAYKQPIRLHVKLPEATTRWLQQPTSEDPWIVTKTKRPIDELDQEQDPLKALHARASRQNEGLIMDTPRYHNLCPDLAGVGSWFDTEDLLVCGNIKTGNQFLRHRERPGYQLLPEVRIRDSVKR